MKEICLVKNSIDILIDETIKEMVNEIIIFTADDDDPNEKESLRIFHKSLRGKIIDLKNHGHYRLCDM